MKSNSIVLAAIATGFALAGVTWFIAPQLAPPSRKVATEAGLHVERGRRILDQYNAQLAYAVLVRDQLRDLDFDVDVEDPAALAEDNPEDYEALHTQLWDAFKPTDWAVNPPRQRHTNYGNVAGLVRQGVAERNKIAERNATLLDEAISEANLAINVSSGDASGRSYAEAHRLKAIAIYHKALTKQLRATKFRTAAETLRQELLSLAADAVAMTSSQTLIGDSKIDDRIADVESTTADAQARRNQYQDDLGKVDDRIKDFETRLADARTKANVAFDEVQRMRKEGVDFTDPNGAATYTRKLMALADAYGVAFRDAHIIEFGGYPSAEIDYSGDYIRGKYIENGSPNNVTMTLGLSHAQQQHDILAAKVKKESSAVKGLQEDLALLEQQRASYQKMQADAKKTIDETAPIAGEVYDELNQVEAEAVAIEDDALVLLNESISASKQAATLSQQWTRDAGSRISLISTDAKANSAFQARSDDQWLGGFATAQIADAQLSRAAIYLSRYKESNRTASVLSTVTATINIAEADPTAEKEKAADAREAGVETVTDAAGALERAHRALGRHWTLVAQAATANEMLVQFGLGDYVADALTGYRNAIQGREDQPFAKPFRDRIRKLEDR